MDNETTKTVNLWLSFQQQLGDIGLAAFRIAAIGTGHAAFHHSQFITATAGTGLALWLHVDDLGLRV
jgi:hypothetical protein